jgi:hypothetical protein
MYQDAMTLGGMQEVKQEFTRIACARGAELHSAFRNWHLAFGNWHLASPRLVQLFLICKSNKHPPFIKISRKMLNSEWAKRQVLAPTAEC